MLSILAKIFIKDAYDYKNEDTRQAYGILCGTLGVFLNIVLFLAKLLMGLIGHSVAIVADAFNNLSDAASSFVSILGFKLSQKKPDKNHPFGHGRLEYIAGLVISCLIMNMGLELFKSSFASLFTQNKAIFSISAVLMLLGAILVKVYIAFYNTAIDKKINSVALAATAKDSLSDIIVTSLVLLSLFASLFTKLPVDAIAGIVVAIFILRTGFFSAKDTIEPLLGKAPTKDFVKNIENELLQHPPIIAMHDLVVHDYGPGRLIIHLHAEVPGSEDIFELHEVIDKAEVDISQKFKCITVIHLDPIDTKNKELDHYKAVVQEETKHLCDTLQIKDDMTVHDIRMVPGKKQTNLIFDLVVPFSCKKTLEEVRDLLKAKVEAALVGHGVQCVITAERPYV